MSQNNSKTEEEDEDVSKVCYFTVLMLKKALRYQVWLLNNETAYDNFKNYSTTECSPLVSPNIITFVFPWIKAMQEVFFCKSI